MELDFVGKALRFRRSGDRVTVFVATLSFSGYFYAEGHPSCTTENCQINFIFEVIEKRNENLPTAFYSQFDPKDWYVRLSESTQCESVLNRILSKKVVIDCGDFNMRQYYAKKTPLY